MWHWPCGFNENFKRVNVRASTVASDNFICLFLPGMHQPEKNLPLQACKVEFKAWIWKFSSQILFFRLTLYIGRLVHWWTLFSIIFDFQFQREFCGGILWQQIWFSFQDSLSYIFHFPGEMSQSEEVLPLQAHEIGFLEKCKAEEISLKYLMWSSWNRFSGKM